MLEISPRAYIFAAAILLTVPLPWAIAWVVAAVVHELGHCIALVLCGRKIEAIRIDVVGAQIQTSQLSNAEALFCSLAGPVGGMLCLLFGRYFPQLALCAFMQTVFNLLPVYPLDGGRALKGFTEMVFPYSLSEAICKTVAVTVCVAVFAFCIIAASRRNLGILPIVIGVFFFAQMKKVKIPCK